MAETTREITPHAGASFDELDGTLGERQSPIDLDSENAVVNGEAPLGERAENAKAAKVHQSPAGKLPELLRIAAGDLAGTARKTEYTLSTAVRPGAKALFRGSNYELAEFHFHSPAEHTVDGVRHNLELHLVHLGKGDDKLVVAVHFKVGDSADPHPFLERVFKTLPETFEDTVPLSNLSLLSLALGGGTFFFYDGSLTTPPYTEGVRWCVLQQVHEMSAAQLAQFRTVVPFDNFRELQEPNGRAVSSGAATLAPAYKPRCSCLGF